MAHWSSCSIHNEPALSKGECDCSNDAPEINQKRFDTMDKVDPLFWVLTKQEKWDVIEGRCRLSSYQNVPILDYSLKRALDAQR